MKKFFLFFALVTLFVGCTQENELLKNQKGEILMDSHVSKDHFNGVNKKIRTLFATTRSENVISEDEAMKILSPLVESGKEIREDFISLQSKGEINISSNEMSELCEMDDSQLAELAYFMEAATQVSYEDYSGLEEYSSKMKYKFQDFVDCLSFATGVSVISGLYGYVDGTAGLITAKTAWKIARVFIGRTLGAVGVAIAIYDFGDCMYKKSKSVETEHHVR